MRCYTESDWAVTLDKEQGSYAKQICMQANILLVLGKVKCKILSLRNFVRLVITCLRFRCKRRPLDGSQRGGA